MNLREWLSLHTDQEEMREMFCRMDEKMKYLHQRGYYIANFSPDKINVDSSNIDFQSLGPMEKDNYHNLIDHNIYTMAFLSIASYSQCLDYLRPSFLSEQFEQFVPFLPANDVRYYRSVIQEKRYFYLNDYIRLSSQQQTVENRDEGISNTQQRRYTKSTAAGRMYQDNDSNLSSAAYVNIIVLTGFVITLTLFLLLGGILLH